MTFRFPYNDFAARLEQARPGTARIGEQLDRNFAEIERWVNRLAEARDIEDTSYELRLRDVGKVLRFTSASAATLTVPAADQVLAFPTGATVEVYAAGAGGVTISAGSGVTIRNNDDPLEQYQEVRLRLDGDDVWVRSG